ncbi:MAG: metal-dependent transcriptional regulator [Candidatus Thermoplasmatota archaeon]|nr:metal-dependent transcriptional regulator [Candidatus Thermoplasmatota archaeon]
MLSKAEEEYIKTIYLLQQKRRTVRNSEIARALNLKPASVTEMLQRLHKKKLVTHKPYRGNVLTVMGRKIAELDACNIEHVITSESVKQLKQFVENNPDYSRWRQVLKKVQIDN